MDGSHDHTPRRRLRERAGLVVELCALAFLVLALLGPTASADLAAERHTRHAGLADSPWPMFQGGPRHQGRSAFAGPARPELAWSLHLAGMPGSPAIGADGAVYLPVGFLNHDQAGYLYAVRPDGTLRWRAQLPGLPSSTTPAVAADGTVYVHMNGAEGNLVAVERLCAVRPDGTIKWTFLPNGDAGSFASSTQSSPAIGPDGTVYVGSMNTLLCAVTPDGALKWARSPSASSITASPAVGPDGTVYCIDAASTLAAYRPDGTTKWILEADDITGGDGSPAVSDDGTIYVTVSGSSLLLAVSPDGVVKWDLPVGESCVATPALAKDGTVYVGDDGLYAISPGGAVRWHYKPGTLFSSAPPVVSSDGTVYWRESWSFHAVRADGTKRWSLEIPAPENAGIEPAPAIGSDGTLYVPQPDVFDPSNHYLKAYRSRGDESKLTLTLKGLTAGAVRLGGRVTATGKLTPSPASAVGVSLVVQRLRDGSWTAMRSASTSTTTAGVYGWTYRPPSRGSYRIRAGTPASASSTAVTSAWRTFRVR